MIVDLKRIMDNREDNIIEEILAKEREDAKIPIDKVREYLKRALRWIEY